MERTYVVCVSCNSYYTKVYFPFRIHKTYGGQQKALVELRNAKRVLFLFSQVFSRFCEFSKIFYWWPSDLLRFIFHCMFTFEVDFVWSKNEIFYAFHILFVFEISSRNFAPDIKISCEFHMRKFYLLFTHYDSRNSTFCRE